MTFYNWSLGSLSYSVVICPIYKAWSSVSELTTSSASIDCQNFVGLPWASMKLEEK